MNEPTISSWQIAHRVAAVDNEYRLAWVRLVLIAVFLAGHFLAVALDPAIAARNRDYHLHLPLYCGIWSLVSWAVLLIQSIKQFFRPIPFLVIMADVANLTIIAAGNGGAQSNVVPLFFLIILSATLRLNLWLVVFSSLTSLVALLGLIGAQDPVWFDEQHAVPLKWTITWCLAILAAGGICLWQVIYFRKTMIQIGLLSKRSS